MTAAIKSEQTPPSMMAETKLLEAKEYGWKASGKAAMNSL